ncbi:radical SAM protein [Mucilaginibacter hurinus]|uniref:Chorismate dehydratase n=1 Tax=Mucilaginibacter hurinus TaxID=2201324 RepID=A0A367GKX3_9SPHI|nr:menaquinone biosynthesis protein [Mucilaginibacter hurinus]RCH53598.1 radical SAM protein [Mucilaginibacter hurinus]
MKKIRISAVSYTNTKPFIYGIDHLAVHDKIHLSLDVPADCAQKLIDDRADIGLIPVAAILNLPQWEIVSDYCIGANGAVNSVFIFSDVPVQHIKRLQLDPQSRTSNNLAKVLLKSYWKLNPQLIVNADDYSASADSDTAFVQIGDRTFGKKNKYRFAYDLAEEWQRFTSLPFVFAAWVANKPISTEFMAEFNNALKYGLDSRKALFVELPHREDFDIEDYLMNRVDFNLTANKKQALHLFLDYVKAL